MAQEEDGYYWIIESRHTYEDGVGDWHFRHATKSYPEAAHWLIHHPDDQLEFRVRKFVLARNADDS